MKYILILILALVGCITNTEDEMKSGMNEAVSGGWSANGILVTGSDNNEVSLQVQFPISREYTVQFLVHNIDPPGLGVPTRCVAFITWAVEGNFVTRRVNVGNGVSVTGIGQAVRIVIKDTTDKAGAHLGNKYRVDVQVAPGARPSVDQAPTLYPFPGGDPKVVAIGAGLSFDFPIPSDAGVISVEVSVFSGAPIAEMGVVVTHLQTLASLKVYDPRAFSFVPVAPGADIIRVTNLTAIDIFVQCTFGIDG